MHITLQREHEFVRRTLIGKRKSRMCNYRDFSEITLRKYFFSNTDTDTDTLQAWKKFAERTFKPD